jgi:hypothetical protein
MENSRCQSEALFFKAAAYETLDWEEIGGALDGPSLCGFGVATLVPSGVCASTFEPSKECYQLDHPQLNTPHHQLQKGSRSFLPLSDRHPGLRRTPVGKGG